MWKQQSVVTSVLDLGVYGPEAEWCVAIWKGCELELYTTAAGSALGRIALLDPISCEVRSAVESVRTQKVVVPLWEIAAFVQKDQVRLIMENSDIRSLMQQRVKQSESHYGKRMEEETKGRYACGKRLFELSEKCTEDAIDHFRKITIDFSRELRSEFENILKDRLERKFFSVAEENNNREKALRHELMQASGQGTAVYTQLMNKIFQQQRVVNVDKAHGEAFGNAMEFLNRVDASLAPDMRQEYACEMFAAVSSRKGIYVQQSKGILTAKLAQAKTAATDSYKQIMEPKSNQKYLDDSELQKVHTAALTAALQKIRFFNLGPMADELIVSTKAECNILKADYQRKSKERAIASFRARKELGFVAYKQGMSRFQTRSMDADQVKMIHSLCKAGAFQVFEGGDSHEPRADFLRIGQELMDQIQEFLKRLLLDKLAEQAAMELLQRLIL